jgi:tetratricopeptide (TPR) repeat protein
LKLRPNDQSTLQSLATIYQQNGNQLAQQVQALQQQAYALQQELPSASSFNAGGATALGPALQSPVDQARAGIINDEAGKLQTEASKLQTQATAWYQKALPQYRKLTKLNSGDPSTWIQYGLAAQRANDTATAVTAFKRFLKIAPDDPDAASVRQLVKQLAPPPATTGTTSTTSGGTTTG